MASKRFNDFFFQRSLWKIGLLWGFLTGILVAIIQEKEVLNYFLSFKTILMIIFFIVVGGSLYVLATSIRLWNRSKES
jgi:hypothetical protein